MLRILFTTLCLIVVSGCSTVQRAADFVNSNPLFMDITVRQAVTRIIDAGETDEEKTLRAIEVQASAQKVLAFMEGNPTATSSTLMSVIRSSIPEEKLTRADKILVEDLMIILQLRLADDVKARNLPDDTVIAVRSLLNTALSAAVLML